MTARDYIAAVVVTLIGVAALFWLLPLAAQIPFWMPPDVYDRYMGNGASKRPFGGLVMITSVAVGVLVVAVCAHLYLWWTDRPSVIRYASRKKRNP